MRAFILTCIAAATLAACGGRSTGPAAAAPAPAATAPTTLAEGRFETLDREAKIEHMKTVVVPAMTALFKEFDAEHYDELRCEFCHGPSANAGEFHMPNPDLPKLNPAGGFEVHKREAPEITNFMMTRVVPEMAKLIDEEPYNPKTKKGLGCFTCHTMAAQ